MAGSAGPLPPSERRSFRSIARRPTVGVRDSFRLTSVCPPSPPACLRRAVRSTTGSTSRVSSRRWTGRGMPALHHRQQQPDGRLALAPDGLVDGRQGWIGRRGQVDVVEADDADLARDRVPPLVDRADGADRHRVAHGQDGASAGGPASHRRSNASLPAVDAGGADGDRVGGQVDAGLGQRLAVAAQPALDDAVPPLPGAPAARRSRGSRRRGGRAR